MLKALRQSADMLSLMPQGGPSVCNIAVTNLCNATCDFCSFAYDKGLVTDRRYIDAGRFGAALDILHGRGVRYLTFSGGETLLHPKLAEMVGAAIARGMRPSIVTNGWLLPQKLPELRAAGLRSMIISLDAPEVEAHERNRGLKGVCERIRAANATMRDWKMKSIASVTINKLIGDFRALPAFLRGLGFDTVTFSYPKRARLGTSSLVYSETSSLIDYTPDELARAFAEVQGLKQDMAVVNPAESLADMARHLRGQKENFVCYGGLKYFYMDYDYNVFRCDSWSGKMCTVWEFKDTPLIRDGCTACMSDCYRDSSVYLHFAVSIGDAIGHLKKGRLGKAAGALATRNNWRSIKSLLEGTRALSKMMRTN